MKLPPGFGQVVKLGGKRRKPYAARVSMGDRKVDDLHYMPTVKYVGYFATRDEAITFLADYNRGVTQTTPDVVESPLFVDVFEKWFEYYQKKNPDASKSALQCYKSAFKNSEALHAKRIGAIRTEDLQGVISANAGKSKASCAELMKLFHGMFKYAMQNDFISKDYSQYVFMEGKDGANPHKPFTDAEIAKLWESEAEDLLLMIYTGMRVNEFVNARISNIDVDGHYIVGGSKTKAGKDRVIPFHDKIWGFVEKRMEWKSLASPKPCAVSTFSDGAFAKTVKALGMEHTPHDTRHTCATLMERAGVPLLHQKLILGHAVQDLTQGVYTHVSAAELRASVNLLQTDFSIVGT